MNAGEMQSDNSGQSTPEPRSSTELSEPVASFFSAVTLGGFPEPEKKAQPWKRVWKGPQQPSTDGKILVGCPKICVYGSSKNIFSCSLRHEGLVLPEEQQGGHATRCFYGFCDRLNVPFLPLALLTLNQSADIGICDRKQRLGWLLKYW